MRTIMTQPGQDAPGKCAGFTGPARPGGQCTRCGQRDYAHQAGGRQRQARIRALDSDQMTMALTFLAGYSPPVLDAVLDATGPCNDEPAGDYGPEPYCTVCGACAGSSSPMAGNGGITGGTTRRAPSRSCTTPGTRRGSAGARHTALNRQWRSRRWQPSLPAPRGRDGCRRPAYRVLANMSATSCCDAPPMRWTHPLVPAAGSGTWRRHCGPPARPVRPPVTATPAGGLTRGRRRDCASGRRGGLPRRDSRGRACRSRAARKVPGLVPLRREIIRVVGD